MKINSGDFIALSGHSGFGKTTLLRLLLVFYNQIKEKLKLIIKI